MIAVAMVTAGCGAARDPRQFELTLPAADTIAALPVRLYDHSGTIKAVEIPFHQPNQPAGLESDTFVVPIDGRPEAVFVVWLGGLCDDQVDLEYTGADTTFTVVTSRGQGGCRLAGVTRSVVVVFASPVDSSTFIVRDMS